MDGETHEDMDGGRSLMVTVEATRDAMVRRENWSPARVYLVGSGIFLVLISALGFAINSSFPGSAEAAHVADSGHVFGIFETNGWHNLSGMLSGLLALSFAVRPHWARLGAFVKGTMYVAVTLSIAVWGPETFRIASNTADQVAHGSLAVTGLAAALLTPARHSPTAEPG